MCFDVWYGDKVGVNLFNYGVLMSDVSNAFASLGSSADSTYFPGTVTTADKDNNSR